MYAINLATLVTPTNLYVNIIAMPKRNRRKRHRSREGVAQTIAKAIPAQEHFASAMREQGQDRRAHLNKAANELREDMERQSLHIRDLILAQPPIQLLGYLVAQLNMAFTSTSDLEEVEARAQQKEIAKDFQFTLEYVHAVWAGHAHLPDESTQLDENSATQLFAALEDLQRTTAMYCMASTAAHAGPDQWSAEAEFHAKSTWVLIRGNRYQVLEEEFFRFVLAPHSDALHTAYGLDSRAIAAGIQAIADSFRTGFSRAADAISAGMESARALVDEATDFEAAIRKMSEADPNGAANVSAAIRDMFFGGVCNLSGHTTLSAPLLEDLCFEPGENTEFFADGEFKATPMRTLPARIKPGIRLGDDYYATDGQFIRDSAYRAIQRGLLKRSPNYREEWNSRQKDLVEGAFQTLFNRQLAGAVVYREVFYRDPATGQWTEADLVIVLADALVVVEAKAGAMAMHSPATNFDRHERVIRDLIVKAYEQCARFLTYLASTFAVPLYQRRAAGFVEVGRISQRDCRVVLPIGLTVEAFTPFSAMCKEFPEIQPILGKHPFFSMSVDDLLVLNRFLPTTGELLHYLEVRQQVAGIPNAMLFDEIDHLGAYIARNRFDVDIREQLKKADRVTWDAFSDSVDKHFEDDHWDARVPPHQEYPAPLAEILTALDAQRPSGWLSIDARIRNLGGEGRTEIAKMFADLTATLHDRKLRRFQVGGDDRLIVWLCRIGAEPTSDDIRHHGQVTCLANNLQKVNMLRVSFDSRNSIASMSCTTTNSPNILQTDYPAIARDADIQRKVLGPSG
jgi:hypothetical protein